MSPNAKDGYGWRSKIGLLVPSINTVVEHDFHRLAPGGVSVHASRVATERHGELEVLEDMAAAAKASAALVADVQPDVSVFACTSSSFLNGHEWTQQIERELAEVARCPCVSTATAMLMGLRAFGVGRVAVLTPYVAATNERLERYLTAAGFAVTRVHGLEVLDMYSHAAIPPERIAEEVERLGDSDAEAVFIACTQLRTVDVLDDLEARLGRPVVSAVQASLWAALAATEGGRRALPISGFGSLLREEEVAGDAVRLPG